MKKCIVLILSIMMILPLILTVNAADDAQTLTKREAQELVAEAFCFYYSVRCGSYLNSNSYTDVPHEELSNVIIDESMRIDRQVRYFEIIEEKLPNGSFDAMQEYAKTIYSADISSYAYQYAFCFKPSEESDYIEYPLFYRHTDGKLYANPGVPQHGKYFYPFVSSGSILTDSDKIKNNIDNLAIEITSSDAKYATALVSLKIGVSETNKTPMQIECKFVNTDSGWRISESEFSNLMMYDRRQVSKLLTKHEAQELVAEAFKYNYDVRCNASSSYCKNGVFIRLRHEDLSDKNLNGSIDLNREVWYSEVMEEKLLGGSYEAMKEYANNIYTSDIAPDAYANAFRFRYPEETAWREYPLFYRHTDGKLYANPGVAQHVIMVYAVSTNKDNIYFYEVLADVDNLDVELISSDSSSAIAKVGAIIGNDEMNRNVNYLECKFVKTDSGWKIAECEFSNWMMYDRSETSPDTGDSSVNSIIIFTALAPTALISAAVLLKKRRYE